MMQRFQVGDRVRVASLFGQPCEQPWRLAKIQTVYEQPGHLFDYCVAYDTGRTYAQDAWLIPEYVVISEDWEPADIYTSGV